MPEDPPKVHVELVLVVAVGSGYDWHDGLLVLWLAPGRSSVPAHSWDVLLLNGSSSEQERRFDLDGELSPHSHRNLNL